MALVKEQARRKVSPLAAFAIGAAAGSIIALLYAPASGKVTRKRIGMKLRVVGKRAAQLRDVAATKFKGAQEWIQDRMQATNGNGHRRRTTTAHA